MYLSKALKCGCLKPICGKQVGNLWGRLALLHLGRVEKVSITWTKFHTIGSIVSFDQGSSTIAKIYQNWKLLDDAQIKHIGCKKVKFRKSIFESISWGGGAVSLLYAKTFEHH